MQTNVVIIGGNAKLWNTLSYRLTIQLTICPNNSTLYIPLENEKSLFTLKPIYTNAYRCYIHRWKELDTAGCPSAGE